MIRELVATTARDERCPSIAWAVVRDGAIVDGESLDTVYRIASMTKSFTSAAVLALRDEGVLALDEPVAAYAPELAAVRGPAGSAPITLRRLMSMAAGLATDDAWADRHLDITAGEIDQLYAAGPAFACRPDERFEYSNLGFGMIGRVVQRVTGRTVQQHVSDRFLVPLGMHDTTWLQPAHDRWARPHRVEDGTIVPDLPAPLDDGEIAPMGGLWSTVADLTRWITWLDAANHPGADDDHPLRSASRREMQRINTYIGIAESAGHASPAGYGFGLNLRDDATLGMVVAHSGGLPGYGSNMRWIAGRGVGAIALANTTYAPMSELTLKMLHVLHGQGLVPAAAAPAAPLLQAAAERLVALLNAWDDAAAAALFADNVGLDESLARRAAAAARVLDVHGPLTLQAVRPDQATSGVLAVCGATSGTTLHIEVQLSPEPAAGVQWYEVQPT
ncbi:MAG: serine hydrolase domain-containing protein [Actinomycetota bacterium]|nr:serine hydrolase domain-containing protein [Actinomycetota bacterium]